MMALSAGIRTAPIVSSVGLRDTRTHQVEWKCCHVPRFTLLRARCHVYRTKRARTRGRISRPSTCYRTRTTFHILDFLPAMASSSSSNFESIFNASLQAYDNKTKNKLLDHPLASRLQSCDSPNAVLSALQDLIQQFDQRRTGDERLKNWLNPIVNVLYTFSATLGEGVGLVSLGSLSLQFVL
jgi:hypothetical protein